MTKTSFYSMPVFDLSLVRSSLTADEWQLVAPVFKTDGSVKASKPDPKHNLGQSSYIWRMLVFDVSPNPKHQCMPVTADWDIQPAAYGNLSGERDYQKRRELTNILDGLADKVAKCLPAHLHHGTIRWGRALGVLR